MTRSTKFLNILAVSFIISSSTTMAMLTSVECSMKVHPAQKMMYATSACHASIAEHSNLQSSIKDPVLIFRIKELSTKTKFDLPIPAKYCTHLKEGSILQLFEANQYGVFKNFKHLENKALLLNLICKKSNCLPGNTFDEQIKDTKDKFYKNPGSPWVTENSTQELEDAGIIIKTRIMRSGLCLLTTIGMIPIIEEVDNFSHGPNGCSDEETLIRSITQ